MIRFASLAFLTFAVFNIEAYVFLSDCSVGGIRDSKWIDDVDKSTACLPSSLRYTLLFLVPMIWFVGSLIILKKFKRKNN